MELYQLNSTIFVYILPYGYLSGDLFVIINIPHVTIP